jgi:hypothetical protein
MNTALEYSTRVVQEGGRRCKKSTLNDLVHLTPLRIPLMNPPNVCIGGFIKGILRGVRCTKSLRALFLHRRPPSWTTLVLYSRAVFIFNEPALSQQKMEVQRGRGDKGVLGENNLFICEGGGGGR